MGAGTLIASGAFAYLFLAVGARTLGAARFAPLGALWALVFLATAALAAPLETELARRIGAARGRSLAYARDVRAAFALALAAGLIATAMALAVGPVLDDRLFGGQRGFTLLGATAFAGLACGAAAKGSCAGAGRLACWGAYLFADGSVRLGFALVTSHVWPTPHGFALALALGPWIALAAPAPVLRWLLRSSADRGPVPEGGRRGGASIVAAARDLAGATSPLVVAAGASSALTYLGAVLLPALVSGPDARVGAYVAALSLARLPLFAFSPLVALAVPRIAFAVAAGEGAASRVAIGLIAVALGGALFAFGGAAVAGSAIVLALFGPGFQLSSGSLFSIGLAAGAWLVATAAAAVAISTGRPRLAAASWCLGLVAALATGAWPVADQFVRTNVAIVSGALVAACAALLVALSAVRAPAARAALS